MDSTGTKMILGGSTDQNTATSWGYVWGGTGGLNPYIIFYKDDGTAPWGGFYNDGYNSISAVKFNTIADRVIAVMGSGNKPLFIVIHDVINNGNILRQYKLSRASGSNGRVVTVDTDSVLFTDIYFYLGMRDDDGNHARISKFGITPPTVVREFEKISSSQGQVSVLMKDLSSPSFIFAGGYLQPVGNKIPYIQRLSSNDLSINWGRVWNPSGSSHSNWYFFKRMSYWKDPSSSQDQLLGCLENTDKKPNPLGFYIAQLNGGLEPTDSFYTYSESAADLECSQIYLEQPGIGWAFINNPSSTLLRIAQLDLNLFKITFSDLPLHGQMYHAYFYPDPAYQTKWMYVGYISSTPTSPAFNNPPGTINKKISFVMPFDLSNVCLQYTYTLAAQQPLSSQSTQFQTLNQPPQTTPAYQLESGYSLDAAKITNTNNFSNKFCTPTYAIFPDPLPPLVYTIGNPLPAEHTMSDWTLQLIVPPPPISPTYMTCTDFTWSYTITLTVVTGGGGGCGGSGCSLPAKGVRYLPGRRFSVYTTNLALVGQYNIQVSVTLPNGQPSTTSFLATIDLPPICMTTVTLTAKPVPFFTTYNIWDTINMYIHLGSTTDWQNPNYCPQATFVLNDINTLQPADSSIFSLGTDVLVSAYGQTQKLRTYHLNLVGTYQLLPPLPPLSASFNFYVDLVDTCTGVQIITSPITSVQAYDMDSGKPLILGTAAFTKTTLLCPNIVYSIIDTETGDIADPLFQMIAINKIQVYTSNPQDIRIYNLLLRGTIQGGSIVYDQEDVPFTVIVQSCINTKIYAPTYPDMKYIIGSPQLIIDIGEWTEGFGYCGAFTYSAAITPNSKAIAFIKLLKKIFIQSTNVADVGIFKITITGQLPKKQTKIVTFTVEIVLPDNTAPYFEPPLQNISMQAYQIHTFQLPPIKDDQGDKYTTNYQLGVAAQTFTQFNNGKFTFSPGPNQVGTAMITITLKDNNRYNPKQNIYVLAVTVLEPEFIYINGKEVPNKKYNSSIPDQKISRLKAKITKISNAGVVTVTFSSPLIVPQTYPSFDSRVLGLTILPGVDQNPTKLGFRWYITGFTSTTMTIQLDFADPLYISKGITSDQLQIQFYAPAFFVEKSTLQSIEYNYVTSKSIPSQMPRYGTATSLSKIANTMSSGTTGFMIGNFAINLLMYNILVNLNRSGSLQLLWSAINTMQLIVHVPLFNIDFPANAHIMYNFLVSGSQFNIIPPSLKNKILIKLFALSTVCNGFSCTLFVRFEVLDNPIHNVSIVVLTLFRGAKIYNTLSRLIYFNLIIRYMILSYLEFAISSLLNLTQLRWRNSLEGFCSFLSIFMTALVIAFPILVGTLTIVKKDKVADPIFRQRCGTLYYQLKENNIAALLYYTLFLVRRLLFAATAIFLDDHSYLQIQLLTLSSISLLMYLVILKPFSDNNFNKLEIFNEVCILIVSYHLYMFTNFNPDYSIQFKAGSSIIFFTTFNISVNMIIIIINAFRQLAAYVRYLQMKCKQRRELNQKKYLEQSGSQINLISELRSIQTDSPIKDQSTHFNYRLDDEDELKKNAYQLTKDQPANQFTKNINEEQSRTDEEFIKRFGLKQRYEPQHKQQLQDFSDSGSNFRESMCSINEDFQETSQAPHYQQTSLRKGINH